MLESTRQLVRVLFCPILVGALSVSACGGGGGGGGGGDAGSGTNRILASGGEGTLGDGGNGGAIFVAGARGAPIQILRSGSVDARVDAPRGRPVLGANPLVITSPDAELTPVDGQVPGGENPLEPATGVEVRAGARRTRLPPDSESPAALQLSHGLIVDGELRAGTTGLDLAAAGVVVGPDGTIVMTGQEGGSSDDPPRLAIECFGALINRGRIATTGQSGLVGGRGGEIAIESIGLGGIYNDGEIDSSGGSGSAGAGGDGGVIGLVTPETPSRGPVYNNGTIVARGGSGSTRGGNGGGVQCVAEGVGSVGSAGTIDVSGGAGATAVEVDPGVFESGGDAGNVQFVAFAGEVRVAGSLTARGGSGFEGANGRGGDGGDVNFVCLPPSVQEVSLSPSSTELFEGPIAVGASIDTRGGRGARGGDGGSVNAIHPSAFFGEDGPESSLSQPVGAPAILFAGFERIDVSGGASTGGKGGDAAARAFFGEDTENLDEAFSVFARAGVLVRASTLLGTGAEVRCEVDIIGRGGDATPDDQDEGGEGGRGAVIEMVRVMDSSLGGGAGEAGRVESDGLVDARGGNGAAGGRGGSFALLDPDLVVRFGDLLVAGGSVDRIGGTVTSTCGAGGLVVFLTTGVLDHGGRIDAAGGSSTLTDGGAGGLVALLGEHVSTSADLSVRGGDGADLGGDGGRLDVSVDEIFSALRDESGDAPGARGILIQSAAAPSRVSGTLRADGGLGGLADGSTGTVLVDGLDDGSGFRVLP